MRFAEENNYDDPEMVYDDADISGLDYHMMRPLIEMFAMASLLYIKKDAGDYDLYLAQLKEAVKNLSVKELHLFAELWVLLVGKMPSGAYETSIGDSWYTAVILFSYIWYKIVMNPAFGEIILTELRANRYKTATYGDDHFMGRRRIIQKYVNERDFAEYAFKYFGLKIKMPSLREGLLWLSVPDEVGGLSYSGVVFCQKYSIRRPDWMPSYCAAIVPYRLMKAVMYKLGYGSRDRYTVADYLMAIISTAYDGFGTNKPLYIWQARLYNYVFARRGYKNMADVISDYSSQETKQFDLTKTCRKIGVAVEQIYQGFPTMETLWRMHIRDDKLNEGFPGCGFFHGEK
jgi:hypothetical protein